MFQIQYALKLPDFPVFLDKKSEKDTLCTLKDKKGHFGSLLSFTVHVKFKSTKMTPEEQITDIDGIFQHIF